MRSLRNVVSWRLSLRSLRSVAAITTELLGTQTPTVTAKIVATLIVAREFCVFYAEDYDGSLCSLMFVIRSKGGFAFFFTQHGLLSDSPRDINELIFCPRIPTSVLLVSQSNCVTGTFKSYQNLIIRPNMKRFCLCPRGRKRKIQLQMRDRRINVVVAWIGNAYVDVALPLACLVRTSPT